MTTGKISRRIIVDRPAQLDHLLKQVRAFPLDDRDAFFPIRAMFSLPNPA